MRDKFQKPSVKLLLAALVAMLLVCTTSRAQGFTAHVGTVPNAYNFWFHAPAPPLIDYEGTPIINQTANSQHYPLLIFLHGRSLCGNNLAKVKRYGAIDAVARGRSIDCYIMAPQNPGGSWNPHKIMNIVDWAVKHYNVDTTRIYVYGMSLGGYGTIDLAATYPDRIAAAMALCGGGSVKDLSGLSKLPLWIVHGTADRAVPVSASDRVVAAIKATGDDSRLIYTRMPGIDHGRPARIFYMGQTYDWLFSHSLLDPNREVNRDFVITAEMLQNAYQDLGRNFQPDYDE